MKQYKQEEGRVCTKVWFHSQICRIIDVLSTRILEAEGCQQPHLMGKGSNEFLITGRHYFSDLILTDIGREFS